MQEAIRAIRQFIQEATMSLDEREDARLKYWSGCAMRALESITGTQATDFEWQRRLMQLKIGRDNIDIDFLDDLREIEFLIRVTAMGETPMGKALSQMEVCVDKITPTEMKSLVESGYQILLAIIADVHSSFVGGRAFITDVSDLGKGHGFHLGVDDRGNFFSRSDGDIVVKLDDSEKYSVLIFG